MICKRSILRAATVSLFVAAISSASSAAIYIEIPPIRGDITSQNYDAGKYFTADSFSFSIEPEMKESSVRPTISITMPYNVDSLVLLEAAVAGDPLYDVVIGVAHEAGSGEPVAYLKYKLKRCWVKSWSTSGDADDRSTEEVTFVFEFDAADIELDTSDVAR